MSHALPPAGSGRAGNLNGQWLWVAAAILLAIACFDLIEPAANLPFRVPRNINEGWNAYWAIAAVSGGQLYPPMAATISNNYPPVSFFLVGFLGLMTGDPVLAGRAVALVSFLVVVADIFIWLRLNGVRGSLATAGAAAFVITLDALSHGSIATNDPQWLAHAFATTGLVILWPKQSSTARLAWAANLAVLGAWVKHLVLPLPAAIAIWLARTDPRALWKWAGFAGILSTLFLGAAVAGYGQAFLDGVLSAPRKFSLGRSALMARAVLPALFPLLCLATVTFRHFRRNSAARFVLLYFVLAAISAAMASGGDGVSENAFFDVAIAAALAAGLALEELLPCSLHRSPPVSRLCFALLLPLLILVVWVPFAFRANIQRLQSLAAEIQATPDDIQFLRRHGSQRAACESLSLCFWSDAPFNIDFFNLGQKLKTGRVPMDACSVLFDGAHFSVIQMYTLPTTVDSRLPVACNRAMIEHYDVARVSINGVFLLPRPQPHAASMSPAFTS